MTHIRNLDLRHLNDTPRYYLAPTHKSCRLLITRLDECQLFFNEGFPYIEHFRGAFPEFNKIFDKKTPHKL